MQCIEGVSLRLQSMDTRPLQDSLPRVCDSLKGAASELFIGVAGVGGSFNFQSARSTESLQSAERQSTRDQGCVLDAIVILKIILKFN